MRTLHKKMQGLVVGMVQAAILLDGQIGTDDDGFIITFSEVPPPYPLESRHG